MRTFVWKGSAFEALFKNSKDVEEYQAVWKMVVRSNGTYETNSLYSIDNLRSVLQGKAVIVGEITTMRYHVSRASRLFRNASFYFAKEQFFPHKFAIALRKGTNSSFLDFLNK
ncbi:putative glutamate receptor, partial [Ixodes scapularis]